VTVTVTVEGAGHTAGDETGGCCIAGGVDAGAVSEAGLLSIGLLFEGAGGEYAGAVSEAGLLSIGLLFEGAGELLTEE